MPKEAKRKLSDVPAENSFIMHFGTELRNLEDLYHVLGQVGEASFKRHVNKEHNDFASWIRYSVMDIELSDRLDITIDRTETKAIIKSRIKYLRNKIREAHGKYYEAKNVDDTNLPENLKKDLKNREKHFVSGIYSKREHSDFSDQFPDLAAKKVKANKTVPKVSKVPRVSKDSKVPVEKSYQYPPANTGVGYRENKHESVSVAPVNNNPELVAKAMKKYVGETIRDVLVGLFFGVVIGFFIALSCAGLI